MIDDYEFVECDSCRAKQGTTVLCSGCLHNRRVIAEFRQALERFREEIEAIEP
jgi:hypothetical protein